MFYLLLIGSSFFLHLTDRERASKYIFYVFSLIVLLAIALRGGGTGLADYDAYIRIYMGIVDWFDVVNPTSHVEIGFRVVSYIGNLLDFDGQFIIIFMAFASFIPVALLIKDHSPYRLLSYVVWFPYILSMNMQSSRISVAVAFGVLFFVFFFKRRAVLSVIFFSLAVSFHASLLLLSLVLLTRLKTSLLASLYFGCLLISFVVSLPLVAGGFLDLVGLNFLSYKFISYIDSADYGYAMRIYDPRLIISFILVAVIMWLDDKKFSPFHNYLFKLFVIGSIILISLKDVTILAWRLSYIFLIVSVVVVPVVSKYIENRLMRNQKIVYMFIPGLYLVLSVIIAAVAEPYNLFFDVS